MGFEDEEKSKTPFHKMLKWHEEKKHWLGLASIIEVVNTQKVFRQSEKKTFYEKQQTLSKREITWTFFDA